MKNFSVFKFVNLVSSCLLLFSCHSLDLAKLSNEIEQEYGFSKELVRGGDFLITIFRKNYQPDRPYIFYIEGDGLAFIGKYQISANPTPRNKMLIKLAAMDPRANIIYVARPCQYTPMSLNQLCVSDYWTDKRMSEKVVSSINEVINKVNNGKKFTLVGFSGGGGIAAIITARNKKVKKLITIAGNLDHIAFSAYHRAIPISSSLNPIDFAQQIRQIPQIHLSGAEDKIVPPFIAKNFITLLDGQDARQITLPDVSHNQGWEKYWLDFCL